jgi:hypothetical protein
MDEKVVLKIKGISREMERLAGAMVFHFCGLLRKGCLRRNVTESWAGALPGGEKLCYVEPILGDVFATLNPHR